MKTIHSKQFFFALDRSLMDLKKVARFDPFASQIRRAAAIEQYLFGIGRLVGEALENRASDIEKSDKPDWWGLLHLLLQTRREADPSTPHDQLWDFRAMTPCCAALTSLFELWEPMLKIGSWTELEQSHLHLYREEYRALLVEETRIFEGGAEIKRALMHETPAAALLIAEKLTKIYSVNHALVYPWLALGGSMCIPGYGSMTSAARIACLFVGSRLANAPKTAHLANAWLAAVDLNLVLRGTRFSDFQTSASALLDAELLKATEDTEQKAEQTNRVLAGTVYDDEPQPPRPPKPSRLPKKGEPSRTVVDISAWDHCSGDDARLMQSWTRLKQPLRLAAGIEPALLKTVLQGEFPWLEEAIDAVVGDLELRRRSGHAWAHFRPLLLVGPPGSGKTRFARRVAELLKTGFGEVSAGGSTDNRALAGTARGWNSASPSYVLYVMRQHETANPLLFVDEVDKSGGGRNGDIKRTLLAMLEPLSAKAWPDECLLSPCDLSSVNWILAANDAEPLRGPLLTRLRTVETPLPRGEHFDSIMASIERDLAAELGVSPQDLPSLPQEAQERLRRAFDQGISLRRIRAALEGAVRVSEPNRLFN